MRPRLSSAAGGALASLCVARAASKLDACLTRLDEKEMEVLDRLLEWHHRAASAIGITLI